jgi:hypothetical protein
MFSMKNVDFEVMIDGRLNFASLKIKSTFN